jgi:transcriptional regulator with XRE-family HTH domain
VQREHVARALRLLRQQRGMTQTEVARRAGVTNAMVSAYERGRRTLYVDTLFRLLAAMGCRARDFGRAVEYVERHPPVE